MPENPNKPYSCDNFFLVLQHILVRYVLNRCDQAADIGANSNFPLVLHVEYSLAIHKATLFQFQFWNLPVLLNFMQLIG